MIFKVKILGVAYMLRLGFNFGRLIKGFSLGKLPVCRFLLQILAKALWVVKKKLTLNFL
jgi:hypothetical protein